MKVPALKIKCDSAATEYYIYRDTYQVLSNNILDYNDLTPVAICTNDNLAQIDFHDDNKVQYYIKKITNGALTITKPTVDVTTDAYFHENKFIPFYIIHVSGLEKPVRVYYRLLAKNSTGDVSKLSNLITVEIQQDIDDIGLFLERYINSSWLRVKKIDYDMDIDCRDVEILNPLPYCYNKSDIAFDDKYSLSYNTTILSVKNIWHKQYDKIHYSDTYPLRIKCIDANGVVLTTQQINSDKIFNPIDKLVILKKEYDNTNDDLSEDDKKVEKKEILRANGIYLKDDNTSSQFNEEVMRSNVYIVNSDNVYKKIKIVDNNICYGKTYKYTFICYDHNGNESKKYTTLHKVE